jgi:hypothetical protein
MFAELPAFIVAVVVAASTRKLIVSPTANCWKICSVTGAGSTEVCIAMV